MKDQDDFDKELNDLPPFLKKMKGEDNPFSTPKHYFNGLGEHLLSKMKEEEALTRKTEVRPKTSHISFWDRVKSLVFQPMFGMSLAGCAVVVFMISYLQQQVESETYEMSSDALLAELSIEEIDAYVYENIDEFDEDILIGELENDEDLNLASASVFSVMDIDTSITPVPPAPAVGDNSEVVNEDVINPDNSEDESFEGMSAEELLEGITAEDIQAFMDEEGMFDDLFED